MSHLGAYKQARAAYDRAIELDPTAAHAHAGYGLLFLQSRVYQQALEAGEHALLIQPDEPQAVFEKTATLFTMKQYRAGLGGCGQGMLRIGRALFIRFWPIRWQ